MLYLPKFILFFLFVIITVVVPQCFYLPSNSSCKSENCISKCHNKPAVGVSVIVNNTVENTCIYVERNEVMVYLDCLNTLTMPNYSKYCRQGHFCYGYDKNGYRVCCCTNAGCNTYSHLSFKPMNEGILVPPAYYEEVLPPKTPPVYNVLHTLIILLVCGILLFAILVVVFCLVQRCKTLREQQLFTQNQEPLTGNHNCGSISQTHRCFSLQNLRNASGCATRCCCRSDSATSSRPERPIYSWQDPNMTSGCSELLPLTAMPYSSLTSGNSTNPLLTNYPSNGIPMQFEPYPRLSSLKDTPLAISLVGGPQGTTVVIGRDHLSGCMALNKIDNKYSWEEMQSIHFSQRSTLKQNWWQIVPDSDASPMCVLKGRMSEIWKVVECSDMPLDRRESGKSTRILKIIYDQKLAQTELDIYLQLQALPPNANICRLVDHDFLRFSDNHNQEAICWLIVEHCIHGSLVDYICISDKTESSMSSGGGDRSFSWRMCIRILHGISSGLQYLHSELPDCKKYPIVHRDIKSRNILLKQDLVPCICDFGFAFSLHPSFSYGERYEDVGTRRYMSPERLQNIIQRDCTAFLSQDIYSFGLVMWEVLSRCNEVPSSSSSSFSLSHAAPPHVGPYRPPFDEELQKHCNSSSPSVENMLLVVVKLHERPKPHPAWLQHSDCNLLWETMNECWETNYEARLSADCILERLSVIASNYNILP